MTQTAVAGYRYPSGLCRLNTRLGFPKPESGYIGRQGTDGNEENVTETSTGIEVGQAMPAFELPDEEGHPFSLLEQLHEGPVVLVFYRGDW